MTDTRTRPMAKALSVGPARALALGLALGLALAGCKDEAEETGAVQSGGQAAGEVLGGTISDDMLPLEQLTSTSPLAPRETVTQTISEGEDGSLSVETTIERTQGTQSAAHLRPLSRPLWSPPRSHRTLRRKRGGEPPRATRLRPEPKIQAQSSGPKLGPKIQAQNSGPNRSDHAAEAACSSASVG